MRCSTDTGKRIGRGQVGVMYLVKRGQVPGRLFEAGSQVQGSRSKQGMCQLGS